MSVLIPWAEIIKLLISVIVEMWNVFGNIANLLVQIFMFLM